MSMPFDRFGDDFNAHARIGSERLRADDRDDYNHAMAQPGRGENGRMLEHVNADGAAVIKDRKKRESTERFLREFWRNQEYLAQYAAFGDTLRDAETKIQNALVEMRGALANLDSAIKDAQAGGTRLADGRIVFKRDDGSVIDQDLNPVDPADVEGVEFNPNAMRGEDYEALHDVRDSLAQRIKKAERFEIEVLGHARDRYEDQVDRITPQEMKHLDLQINGFLADFKPAPDNLVAPESPGEAFGFQPPAVPTWKK
ncbi:MAG: hypothetical protein AAF412_00630 [Pseudomonadota bacterium]